jgi:hypothetical protein
MRTAAIIRAKSVVHALPYNCAPMHPMLRNTVIGVVGLIIAGGLTALALLGRDSNLSVLGLLAAGVIGALIGLFLYSQGWVWGSRAARQRDTGQAVLIAIGAGLMALVAAVALAGLLVLALLFLVD